MLEASRAQQKRCKRVFLDRNQALYKNDFFIEFEKHIYLLKWPEKNLAGQLTSEIFAILFFGVKETSGEMGGVPIGGGGG